VNRTVSAAILSSFAWVYGATSVTVQGSLLVCSCGCPCVRAYSARRGEGGRDRVRFILGYSQ
jgi:hypothetical protein